VPYDPYLPNVFNGEELSRGIRFFTHGYDMYTPDQVLAMHDYNGHQNNPIVNTWSHLQNEKSPVVIAMIS
jgi:Glycosyltransferase (GlcNAc)